MSSVIKIHQLSVLAKVKMAFVMFLTLETTIGTTRVVDFCNHICQYKNSIGQANLTDKLVTLWSHHLSRLMSDNLSM